MSTKKFLNNDFPKKEDMIFVSVNGNEVPKEGYEEIRDEDGKLIGKGNYKNGVRSEFWQFFYPNGKIDNCGYYGNDGLRLSINEYGDTWDYYYEDGFRGMISQWFLYWIYGIIALLLIQAINYYKNYKMLDT